MKILMISGDRHLLEPGTEAYTRLALQRAQVDELDVFVWPQVHTLWAMYKAARTKKYDVVTAQDPFWRGHIALHLTQLFGSKLNLQVHSDLSAYSVIKRWLALWNLRKADSVRVVSEKIKQQVIALGVKAPIYVLPVFVDLERFRTISPRPHMHKTILWVGRFAPEKNPLQAISILKEVRRAGADARLIMLGSGGLEAVLKQTAKGAPVTFPGWKDLREYLGEADVVLSTSRHESWGASIVEALAAGVPVVAPDVGIAREAGAIVVPRSGLASAVVDALTSGTRGELKLATLSREEWARQWRETLV